MFKSLVANEAQSTIEYFFFAGRAETAEDSPAQHVCADVHGDES